MADQRIRIGGVRRRGAHVGRCDREALLQAGDHRAKALLDRPGVAAVADALELAVPGADRQPQLDVDERVSGGRHHDADLAERGKVGVGDAVCGGEVWARDGHRAGDGAAAQADVQDGEVLAGARVRGARREQAERCGGDRDGAAKGWQSHGWLGDVLQASIWGAWSESYGDASQKCAPNHVFAEHR